MGVLWHHSSVNLVGPRSIALTGPAIPRRLPEIDKAVSIPVYPPQPPQRLFPGKFRHNSEEIPRVG